MITKVTLELETQTKTITTRPLKLVHHVRTKLSWYNDGQLEGFKYFKNMHDAALWIVEEEVHQLLSRSDGLLSPSRS